MFYENVKGNKMEIYGLLINVNGKKIITLYTGELHDALIKVLMQITEKNYDFFNKLKINLEDNCTNMGSFSVPVINFKEIKGTFEFIDVIL